MALLVFLSSSCGLFWGLVGFWLARDMGGMRPVAWVGLAASPLIGLCVGLFADRMRPKGWLKQILFALLTLYGAVTLFILTIMCAMAVRPGPVSGTLQPPGLFGLIADLPYILFYFSVFGYGVILWPVAVINHRWLWSVTEQVRN